MKAASLFEARIQTPDPETAASYLPALGTHGQPGDQILDVARKRSLV